MSLSFTVERMCLRVCLCDVFFVDVLVGFPRVCVRARNCVKSWINLNNSQLGRDQSDRLM